MVALTCHVWIVGSCRRTVGVCVGKACKFSACDASLSLRVRFSACMRLVPVPLASCKRMTAIAYNITVSVVTFTIRVCRYRSFCMPIYVLTRTRIVSTVLVTLTASCTRPASVSIVMSLITRPIIAMCATCCFMFIGIAPNDMTVDACAGASIRISTTQRGCRVYMHALSGTEIGSSCATRIGNTAPPAGSGLMFFDALLITREVVSIAGRTGNHVWYGGNGSWGTGDGRSVTPRAVRSD